MEYRTIGKTGMSASVIGFGGEHLDGRPYEEVEAAVSAALEEGVNILDLFMPGESVRANFGKAMRGNREKFLIQGHIGSTDIRQQYDISRDLSTCKTYFENLLRDLGTDYIDFGMLFFIDSQEDFDNVFHGGIADYAQQLKKQGTIRAIGASSHNPEIAKKVVDTGLVELLMFSINPAFDMTPPETGVLTTLEKNFEEDIYAGIQPQRLELYRLCEQRDVSITVMKTLGAGKLLSKEHTPFREPMSVAQCVHYALTRPAVVSALLGCKTPEEIRHACGYLTLSNEEKDYSSVVGGMENNFAGHCVYCSHCQPCPVEIDIAAVNKYLDIAELDENSIPPSIRQHYGALSAAGSDCIACGNCESRCPFDVPIIGNMEQAARLFGR